MKEFTTKEFYIAIFSILVGIAILESAGPPMWTLDFWREFLLKMLIYIPASVVILMIVGSVFDDK